MVSILVCVYVCVCAYGEVSISIMLTTTRAHVQLHMGVYSHCMCVRVFACSNLLEVHLIFANNICHTHGNISIPHQNNHT